MAFFLVKLHTRKRVFVDVIFAVHSRWLFKKLISVLKRCSEKRFVKIDNPSCVIPLAIDELLKGLKI